MLRSFTLALVMAGALSAQDRVPVVVELFTSEGCSSCPPADSLLAELEAKQPLYNVDLIVLSEHVDYWNRLGWKDPFSSALFSHRQESYAALISGSDVYTPEAIIDGHFTTVGSDRQNVMKAIMSSGEKPKPELQLAVTRQGNALLVNVPQAQVGDTWIALTEAKTVSHVAKGENGGRTLQHVGVVRSLKKSNGQTRIEIDKSWGSELRVVAFVQDARSGRILQAAQKKI
jgi:hypothetical protein